MGSEKKDHGGTGLFLKVSRVGIMETTIKETLKIWDAGPRSVFDLQEGLGACSLFELRSLLQFENLASFRQGLPAVFLGHIFSVFSARAFSFFRDFQ